MIILKIENNEFDKIIENLNLIEDHIKRSNLKGETKKVLSNSINFLNGIIVNSKCPKSISHETKIPFMPNNETIPTKTPINSPTDDLFSSPSSSMDLLTALTKNFDEFKNYCLHKLDKLEQNQIKTNSPDDIPILPTKTNPTSSYVNSTSDLSPNIDNTLIPPTNSLPKQRITPDKRMQIKPATGTSDKSCLLKSSTPILPKSHLFITRFHPDTNPKDINDYLTSSNIQFIKVYPVKSKFNSYTSFCIECNSSDFKNLQEPSQWPSGILIMPFKSSKIIHPDDTETVLRKPKAPMNPTNPSTLSNQK